MRFTDSLDRNLEDIKRPPNLPIGHYTWQVTKHPEVQDRDSANGSFQIVKFSLSCIAPDEDVDPDDLEEYGNVEGAVVSRDFIFSNAAEDKAKFEQSMFRLKQFLGHLGLEDDMPLSEALAASVGRQCKGKIKHRPDPSDSEIVYQEIERTSKA